MSSQDKGPTNEPHFLAILAIWSKGRMIVFQYNSAMIYYFWQLSQCAGLSWLGLVSTWCQLELMWGWNMQAVFMHMTDTSIGAAGAAGDWITSAGWKQVARPSKAFQCILSVTASHRASLTQREKKETPLPDRKSDMNIRKLLTGIFANNLLQNTSGSC